MFVSYPHPRAFNHLTQPPAHGKVVQFLVKPATEAARCRFADLPAVKPYSGPATVFMSHAWGGKWGNLVAAAVSGGRHNRFVWIDAFAVRDPPPLFFFRTVS